MVPRFIDVAAAAVELRGSAIVASYEIEGLVFRLTATLTGPGTMTMRTDMAAGAGRWNEVGHMALQAQ